MISMMPRLPGTELCIRHCWRLGFLSPGTIRVCTTCVMPIVNLSASMVCMLMTVPRPDKEIPTKRPCSFSVPILSLGSGGCMPEIFRVTNYVQDPKTFEIRMSQEKFFEKLRPIHFSRTRQSNREALLSDEEVRCLRAINGGLSTQSRPDLSTQVSFSQQLWVACSEPVRPCAERGYMLHF